MEVLLFAALVACMLAAWVCMFWGAFNLQRNRMVYLFRITVLNCSWSEKGTGRIIPYENLPSYGQMMREFWRPVSSYAEYLPNGKEKCDCKKLPTV